MAPALKGTHITLSGTFPGYKQADLRKEIEKNGGNFSASVADTCTHLVTTQREVSNNGSKYAQAVNMQTVDIVSLGWLLDSISNKKLAQASQYSFGPAKNGPIVPTTSSQAADPVTTTKSGRPSRKRASPQPDDDDSSTKAQASQVSAEPPKKKTDAETKPAPALKVEVDEYAPNHGSYEVYIDEDGTIFDAALNQTNSQQNSNKFYFIQLLKRTTGAKDRYTVWTRWGRVGERGQSSAIEAGDLDNAIKQFNGKFQQKSGHSWANRFNPPKKGKYTFLERNYEVDSESEDDLEEKIASKRDGKQTEVAKDTKGPESALPKAVQQLMSFIFNHNFFAATLENMHYDSRKLPLGKLGKRTLETGFQILKNLSELVDTPSLAQTEYGTTFGAAAQDLSDQYFTTIPHVFGRNRPPVISTEPLIKKEVELLEALTDMEIGNEILNSKSSKKSEEIVHHLDRQFSMLDLQEMTPLDHKSTEFSELEQYLVHSRGSSHHLGYKVEDIFRIQRKNEDSTCPMSNCTSNRRLLWHGSRSTNYGGILSQGLRIAPPEAPVSGYMFGKGVYFADISSKSANYCCPYNSNNTGLLLLCDVEVGDPMLELTNADYHAGDNAKKQGKLATLGRGSTAPPKWKDAGCVHPDLKGVHMPDMTAAPGPSAKGAGLLYNEYIVYNVAQIRLKYLLRVKMT
ncbi:hypothetical protein FQN54_007563 [Arachnomyces sp. PD_36]|nr:hypothetical protein FQN54_007563 [Arachnomyces sp. PD_36]